MNASLEPDDVVEATWRSWLAARAAFSPPAGFTDRAMARLRRAPSVLAPVRPALAPAATLLLVCLVFGALRLLFGVAILLVCVA